METSTQGIIVGRFKQVTVTAITMLDLLTSGVHLYTVIDGIPEDATLLLASYHHPDQLFRLILESDTFPECECRNLWDCPEITGIEIRKMLTQ